MAHSIYTMTAFELDSRTDDFGTGLALSQTWNRVECVEPWPISA